MSQEWMWIGLAQVGYEKYRTELNKKPRQMNVPDWDNISIECREAWIEATKEICDAFGAAALA